MGTKKKLEKEAKQRGFVEGNTFGAYGINQHVYIKNNKLDFDHFKSNNVIYIQGFEIYNNGEWAEIISYKEEIETPKHYDNSKGSIYQFCENQNLNSYEFDIIKRVVRSRKKGNFKEDLEKTKHLIDLYLKEYDINTNK